MGVPGVPVAPWVATIGVPRVKARLFEGREPDGEPDKPDKPDEPDGEPDKPDEPDGESDKPDEEDLFIPFLGGVGTFPI